MFVCLEGVGYWNGTPIGEIVFDDLSAEEKFSVLVALSVPDASNSLDRDSARAAGFNS